MQALPGRADAVLGIAVIDWNDAHYLASFYLMSSLTLCYQTIPAAASPDTWQINYEFDVSAAQRGSPEVQFSAFILHLTF
jgi:hypothetical protein